MTQANTAGAPDKDPADAAAPAPPSPPPNPPRKEKRQALSTPTDEPKTQTGAQAMSKDPAGKDSVIVTPLHRLRIASEARKKEAEFIKRRSAVLAELQQGIDQDIAAMQAEQKEVQTFVTDYGKKETNLQLQRGELKNFVDVQKPAIGSKLKEKAKELEKIREAISRDITEKEERATSFQAPSDERAQAQGDRQAALTRAQKTYDTEKAKLLAVSSNLDALKTLRDSVTSSEDVKEKYVLLLEIEEAVKQEVPGRHAAERKLNDALHALLAAQADYHETAADAKTALRRLTEAKDEAARAQTGRRARLVAAAKALGGPPPETPPEAVASPAQT